MVRVIVSLLDLSDDPLLFCKTVATVNVVSLSSVSDSPFIPKDEFSESDESSNRDDIPILFAAFVRCNNCTWLRPKVCVMLIFGSKAWLDKSNGAFDVLGFGEN